VGPCRGRPAAALAAGLSPEGGSAGARHSTRVTESPLHTMLLLSRGAGGSGKRGFFLRAETMHTFFTYLEQHPSSDPFEPRFHHPRGVSGEVAAGPASR
jgi:predicted ATPase